MRGGALALWFFLAACTSSTSQSLYSGSPLTPLRVSLQIDPAPPADGAYRDSLLRVVLDDYPDPDTIGFGPILLRSGSGAFDVEMTVSLIDRAVLVRPRSLLDPNTTYELLVGRTLRALDGRAVGTTMVMQIPVGAQRKPPAPAAVKPTWNDTICDSNDAMYDPLNVRCVIGNCAILNSPNCRCTAFCHSPVGASLRARQASRRLDLTDPADPVLGLINVPSVGAAGTPYQLMRVSPGDSSRSMLLRKLIGGDAHLVSTDPPYPEMRVPGRRMPLSIDDAAPIPDPLSDDQVRLVQDWIDQGAPVVH